MATLSEQYFELSKQFIPGGVNSPVRAFGQVGGTPIFMARAEGALLYDVDGNRYIDYIGSWGPMILGHAYDPVLDAIRAALPHSTSFGAPTVREYQLAELVCAMVPGVDRVRMVNSGTEACMSAIRVARGATGRTKVIKFAGNYHGHGDSFLIKAGSGATTLGIPTSPGIPPAVAADTLIARYNDLADVERLFAAHGPDIAALIVEPVAGNMGCIPPVPGFLEGLRGLCTRHGAVLIFDEVMTGFRLAPGGAAELYGITPDLVTLGKILGAGLPVGAYGGRADLMAHVAPEGPVYQAGTLSGNPLAMAAGLALLKTLKESHEIYTSLARKTEHLHTQLAAVLQPTGWPYRINRVGSMISVHFTDTDVVDYDTAQRQDVTRFNRLFHHCLSKGVYLPPSAYESWFVSDAHTETHLELTVEAFRSFVDAELAYA